MKDRAIVVLSLTLCIILVGLFALFVGSMIGDKPPPVPTSDP